MSSPVMTSANIHIRPLTGLDEFREAVDLQRVIWGWEDLDLLPVRFFVVAKNIGGQVLGAFDHARLCGFLLAIPCLRNNGSPELQTCLHSHMLGVLPEYRNSGTGYALKIAQRDDALTRGIHLIEWSFDPLDLKNAYFNIEKLGAIVRRFEPNLYGFTSSSLQAGLPTDRCIAEWDVTRQCEQGQSPPKSMATARISIPTDIDRIKRTDAVLAKEIQQAVSLEMQKYLTGGLAITGFERSADQCAYLLSPWPSK